MDDGVERMDCGVLLLDSHNQPLMKSIYKPFNSMPYRGARCDLCIMIHRDAQLIPTKLPQGSLPVIR